jgi:GT2 family glycosyltransferase
MPKARILVTVVLYKMPLTESPAIQGLLQSFACNPKLHDSLSVLIWDNTPAPLTNPPTLSSFIYKHSLHNLGVSGAYNRAMEIAGAMDCQWLLLLDQDTEVPADFLPQMFDLGCKLLNKPLIAAVVPFLMNGDRILSPVEVGFKHLRALRRRFEGVYPRQVAAANSGALMRTDALREIGGFNEDFWLDYSDVAVFHLLHQHGKQVYIAGDLSLQHKISVIDFKNSMSAERYSSFLAAEGAFWDTYRSGAGRAFHTLRIFERAIRQVRRDRSSPYAKITLAYFFRRLFSTRKHRLMWWKLQSLRRDIPG